MIDVVLHRRLEGRQEYDVGDAADECSKSDGRKDGNDKFGSGLDGVMLCRQG
jgi:hypothetical protein